jgi:hypothetical protein
VTTAPRRIRTPFRGQRPRCRRAGACRAADLPAVGLAWTLRFRGRANRPRLPQGLARTSTNTSPCDPPGRTSILHVRARTSELQPRKHDCAITRRWSGSDGGELVEGWHMTKRVT